MSQEKYVLVKVKDPGLPTYTWFWTKTEMSKGSHTSIVSPFFNSEKESKLWMEKNKDMLE
jgi:hypothetical protein